MPKFTQGVSLVPKYLRDETIQNITVDEDLLRSLDHELKRLIDGNTEKPTEISPYLLEYTIRFDGKGYRTIDVAELVNFYNKAKNIERVFIQVESHKSKYSNRNSGSYIEVKLDKLQQPFITVSSDDEAWMNNAFTTIKDLVLCKKNRNGLIRNNWTELTIQLFSVILGFGLSLWGASKISPSLSIENSFLISFLLIMLIFSNLWTQITPKLQYSLAFSFPIVKFDRDGKDKLHWLSQALVGGVIVAITLYFLGGMFSFMGNILGSFVNK